MNTAAPRYLDPRTAAARLGISKRAVLAAVHAGKLRALWLNKRVCRIEAAQLDATPRNFDLRAAPTNGHRTAAPAP